MAATVALRRARPGLRPSWPLTVLFVAYPAWWVLGLGTFAGPIMAVPIGLTLVQHRNLRVPRWFGLWLLFLGWMFVTSVQLETLRHFVSFAWWASMYISATVLFLYVYNADQKKLPDSTVVLAVAALWVYTVVGGFLGLVLQDASFATVVEHLVPVGFSRHVSSVSRIVFATPSGFLSYSLPRPAAPFSYANEWGSNLGLLVPFAVLSWRYLRPRWAVVAKILFGLSIIPAVVSLNRGLWLSLVVVATYVSVRMFLRGQSKNMLRVVVVTAATLLLIALTPLRVVLTDRLETGHSNVGRLNRYQTVVEEVRTSPLLGFGTSRANTVVVDRYGTEGQLWRVLLEQGIPGAVLFVGFLCVVMFRTGRDIDGDRLWLQAVVLVALVQMWFYGLLHTQIYIVMIAAALLLRGQSARPTSDRAEAEQAPLVAAAQLRGGREGRIGR